MRDPQEIPETISSSFDSLKPAGTPSTAFQKPDTNGDVGDDIDDDVNTLMRMRVDVTEECASSKKNGKSVTAIPQLATALTTSSCGGMKEQQKQQLQQKQRQLKSNLNTKKSAQETRLERNRIAARESRRRKKFMIENLQRYQNFFSNSNAHLKKQNDYFASQLTEAKAKISKLIQKQQKHSHGGIPPVESASKSCNHEDTPQLPYSKPHAEVRQQTTATQGISKSYYN